MDDGEKRQNILDTVSDAATDFMYYDRKEDEELPGGAIEQAVKDGIITYEEIADLFLKEIRED